MRRFHSVSPSGSEDEQNKNKGNKIKSDKKRHSLQIDQSNFSRDVHPTPKNNHDTLLSMNNNERSIIDFSSSEDEFETKAQQASGIRKQILEKSQRSQTKSIIKTQQDTSDSKSDTDQSDEEIQSTFPHSFIDENKYKKVSGKCSINDIDTEDAECWIVQCPKNFPPNALIGKKLKLNGGSQFKVNYLDDTCKRFEVHPEKLLLETLSFIVKDKAISLPLQGQLNVIEHIEMPYQEDGFENLTLKEKIAFPNNLKTRHPLFGDNFMNRVKKGKYLKRQNKKKKGKEMMQESTNKDSSNKKKRKREEEHEEEHTTEKIIKQELGISFFTPNKKKHKRVEKKEEENTLKRIIKQEPVDLVSIAATKKKFRKTSEF